MARSPTCSERVGLSLFYQWLNQGCSLKTVEYMEVKKEWMEWLEVIMKRELFGCQISQKSKSQFFSATELVHAGDKFRREQGLGDFNLSLYLKGSSFLQFKEEVEKKYGQAIISGRGRSAQTWVHPLIFIDIALAINPKLKLEVYEWIFDHLIKFRNDSGDSYKEMSAALFTRFGNVREFQKYIASVADEIRDALNVSDWQTATEQQLEKRDKIHSTQAMDEEHEHRRIY